MSGAGLALPARALAGAFSTAMEVQPPELASCGASCGATCQPLHTSVQTENAGCTEKRVLKRIRTEQSDAAACSAQASNLDSRIAGQPSEHAPSGHVAKALKQDLASAPDLEVSDQQPIATTHASDEEPAAAPCAGGSEAEHKSAGSKDTQAQPCNRVLLEPNLLLQQYVELLRSQHPQHVLQALNPLLLLSRNESHAHVLAQYPPLFPALFSAIHAFHVAVDCRLLRCDSNRTGTLAQTAQQPATAGGAGGSDMLAGREGTDEADPGCAQEGGQGGTHKNAESTPEEAWQAQLAVAAATVVHQLATVSGGSMTAESISGVHIICLQHLALLNAQPWQPVLEVGLLLLSAARATIKAAVAVSSLNLCEHLLRVISDPSSPVQVKSLACSTVADALASNQRRQLIRHLSSHRPREPFEAAHALLCNTCKASNIAHMLPQTTPHHLALPGQYAQCMAHLWRTHLVSCGVRLARELLTCVVAGFVNVAVSSLETSNVERISRTFKLCPPSLQLCAPVSPTTLRNFTLRHRAPRGVVSSSCAGGSGSGRNGTALSADHTSAVSATLADAPPSTQQHASGTSSPAASAPTTPRSTRSQLVHSFPCLGCTGTEGGAPAAQPALVAKATPAASTAAVAAGPEAEKLASAQQPAAAAQAEPVQRVAAGEDPCAGDADGEEQFHSVAVPAATEELDEPQSFLGEPGKQEVGFQPALSVEVEGAPGSPSLSMDNMPSFSRWVSMSLSHSISFGGPRGADGEVPDSTLCSFGDAPCGGSCGTAATAAAAESVHVQGAATPALGATVAPQLSRPIMALPQISLAPPLPPEMYVENGVTGSCDALPEVAFRGDPTCGQSGDTLHVPPLLLKTLCHIAASALHASAAPDAQQRPQRQPSLPSQASLSTRPAPAGANSVVSGTSAGADAPSAQPHDKKAADAAPQQCSNDAVASAAATAGAGSTCDSQGVQAVQACAGVSSACAEPVSPSDNKEDPGCVPEHSTEVGKLQALVAATDRQVARAAEQALAVAVQVPELATQVPKQNVVCTEVPVRPLVDTSGAASLPGLDSFLLPGLVDLSRGVAGLAVALDFPL